MKLTCPHSGISYTISSGYGNTSAIHPATQLPFSKLIAQLNDYHAGRIESDSDKYLYLLSWFNQLPNISYRSPCDPIPSYTALLANAELLIRVVWGTNKMKHLQYPAIVVSKDSTLAGCLRNWLDTLQAQLLDAATRSSNQAYNITMSRLESTLDRITTYTLRSNVTRASKLVALWAATAGQFSTEIITSPDNKETTLTEYWQHIIVLSFNESHTELLKSKVPPADISELIEHCEESIPHGSQYAYELMKRLRLAQKQLNELYGNNTESVRVHIQAGTESLIEPSRRQFKSSVEYLKARVKWQSAMMAAKAASKETEVEL